MADDHEDLYENQEENKSQKLKDRVTEKASDKAKEKLKDKVEDKLSDNVSKKATDSAGKEAGKKAAEGVGKKAAETAGTEATKGAAAKSAGAAAAKGAGTAIGGAGIGVLGTVIIVVIVVLLLTGIVVALIYLPGSLIQTIKNFFKSIIKAFGGAEVVMGKGDFAEVANHIRDRGYDLYTEGYINKPLDPEKDFDDSGRIKRLPSQGLTEMPHLIELYTRMDAYTYRVRNNDMHKIFANEDTAGFLYFRVGSWKDSELEHTDDFYKGFLRERIKVSEDRNLLTIKKNLFGGTYNYYMDGWSGRYGMPLELFMALHQGTRAPDLVRNLASGTRLYYANFTPGMTVEITKNDEITDLTSIDFTKRNRDFIYAQRPILNILLLKTDVRSEVKFLVPDSSTINGKVYLLNKELDFDKEYETNPFNFTDADFTEVNSVSGDQLYKTFFKTHEGNYIRIKPKKPGNTSLNYSKPSSNIRYTNGLFETNPVKIKEETKDDENEDEEADETTKTVYKIQTESYDLSKLYFDKSGDSYVVKNKVDEIVNERTFKGYNSLGFVDTYGLYALVDEVINTNNTVVRHKDFYDRIREVIDLSKEETYIPLIDSSEGHWFRDVYFYLKPEQEYIEEDSDYFLLTGEHWAKYDISEEDSKKILTPKMLKDVEPWNAYEIKTTKHDEDALGTPFNSSEEKYAGFSKFMYVHESLTSTAMQREEGRRGMTNPITKQLFTDIEWYKYDGSIEKADEINEDRKKSPDEQNENLKSLVDPDNDLSAAFEILEGSKSLDAQYILRDLKEFYVELGYFEKEDLRDPVRRILRWPLANYKTPKLWPAAEIHQDQEGYGVYIPSKSTLEYIYNEETLEENKDVVGEGFEPDVKVVSPVTGKIEEISTKDVTRLITNKDGKIERITKKVGYITISAIDDTAPEEVKEYKDFYDSEYKQVIAGKVKHGKQSKDNRYLKGNKITIEGLEVEIPENVNDDENSYYIRQLKSSAIRKVQDKETREEAERVEKRKIDAPNYISIGGSEAHVGDYIKEGTVIGKTTDADIRIIMQDSDKAFIENVDHYFVKSSGFYVQIMDDYYTKVEDGEPNIVDDIEMFKYMFEGFPLLQKHAQSFLDIQEEYEINAVFAACVAIQECGAGNATTGVNYSIGQIHGGEYNNIFSIKAFPTDPIIYPSGKDIWRVYATVDEACHDFARIITRNRSGYFWAANDYYVSEIAPTYCDVDWGIKVNSHMTMVLKRAMKKMGISGGGSFIPGVGTEAFQRICEYALPQEGKPYIWGAEGPNSFDCSGLVHYVYSNAGLIGIGRTTADQQFKLIGEFIPNMEDGKPGDIAFFHSTGGASWNPNYMTHVGIYLGDGKMIHASAPGVGVVIQDISLYANNFAGYKRIPGVAEDEVTKKKVKKLIDNTETK